MRHKLFYPLLCFLLGTASCIWPVARSDKLIDVIIPVAGKDVMKLDYCIKGIMENCAGVRSIFIISSTPYTNLAEWVDEQCFPFSKEEVAEYLGASTPSQKRRVGWYYQQLLKLYAAFVIPDISSNILVVDADTIFLRPVTFFSKQGKALYNPGSEHHPPYFQHARRLLPSFHRAFSAYSGIAHHMLFQRECLQALFDQVEAHAQTEFWKAFCKNVDPDQLHASGASEYELYFNFVFTSRYPVELRFLNWANKPPIQSAAMAGRLFHQALKENLDYISCHEYNENR